MSVTVPPIVLPLLAVGPRRRLNRGVPTFVGVAARGGASGPTGGGGGAPCASAGVYGSVVRTPWFETCSVQSAPSQNRKALRPVGSRRQSPASSVIAPPSQS